MLEHFWIWLVTIGYLVSKNLRDTKRPYDNTNEEFHYWKDWLRLELDNILVRFFLSLLGWGVAGEVGAPLLALWFKSIGITDKIATESMQSFQVFIVIIIIIKIFGRD